MILSAAAPPFFAEVVALLVAGAAIAFIGYRLGLVPIVGFLLAGVVIGPNALGLVRRPELVDAAAEVGVILLLFTIGIEFSVEKLGRIKRLIFGAGGLQVALATLLTLGVLMAAGVAWEPALFTGFLVALSSTVIVLKLLSDRGETDEEHGQIGLGVLIFQDLAVIVMVLLVPILAGDGGSGAEIFGALARAVGIIAVVLLFARRAMPRLLEMVARTCSPEIFLLSVVAICFGTAYATSLAGVSLSLGAFLAGLLVSESRFSEHAMGEILPLQILFSATFFVSVGMLLDVRFLLGNLPLVLGAIAAVLVIKLVSTGVSVLALGYPLPMAATAGLMLAQVGEFSFVLQRAGREAGLFPAGLEESGSQTFIAATVVLMVITPQLTQLGARLGGRMDERRSRAAAAAAEGPAIEPHGMRDHVLVAGYGQAARALVRGLERARIPYLVTTLNPGGAAEAESEGRAVLRGDATKQHTLHLAGLDVARVVVIADDDPGTARRIAAVARVASPGMPIVVRTRYQADVKELEESGASAVVTEETESALGVLREVLAAYGTEDGEMEAALAASRRAATEGSAGADPASPRPASDGDAAACSHLNQIREVKPRTPQGCEECLRSGDEWVHLRLCLTCGHVGCCDSSPNRHATAHHHATTHPIARSFEPGERWRWCYLDRVEV